MNRLITTDSARGRRARRCFLSGLLFAVGASAAAVDTVSVLRPAVHPDTPEHRAAVERVLSRAVVLADREYGELFTVTYGGASGTYRVATVVSFGTDQGPVGSLSMSGRGGGEHTFPVTGEFGDDKVAYYAAAIATLWNGFTGGFDAALLAPPEYVDELPIEVVAPLLVPANPMLAASLMPLSGAPLSDGSIVVGMSIAAVRLDSWFRLVGRPGADQVDAGNYQLAGRVFATPADTIILVPPTGRSYFRIIDGIPGSVRQALAADVTATPIAVLPDGSIVQKNMMTNEVDRYSGRTRTTFSLATGPLSYVTLIAAGPDGNLWSWDQVERRIKIFSSDGTLLDTRVPIHRGDDFLSPTALVPAPDGGFLLALTGSGGPELRKYGADGRPIWVLTDIAASYREPLPYSFQPIVDSGGAYLYLADLTGRRIVKLYDRSSAVSPPEEMTALVLELNREISEHPDDPAAYARKARLYDDRGAFELAQASWQRVLEIDPYDPKASIEVRRLELEKLKKIARYQDLATREILETLGVESARMQYSAAIATYERIIAIDPGDTVTTGQKRALEEAFFERSAVPPDRAKPITIVSTGIANLFPSLLNYYRSHPVGTVTVENPLDEPAYDLSVRLLIPRYMAFPTDGGAIERLDPGARATLELAAVLSEEVLTLEEDLRFPAKVEVSYRTGNGAERREQAVISYPAVTIHRRSALSWDDSAKIAAFIVPREAIVAEFAANVVRGADRSVPGVAEAVARAAAIVEAVGVHGVVYIEDPESPFSGVLGKDEVIDTVRFPRETLRYRIGDCDDTTALLASLLEAVGVSTAIMTSPGHVFLAFDTGEPESNVWLYRTDELGAIVADGSVWIPIESTTTSEGFYASWMHASRLLTQHAESVEFLTTSASQATYPPIPLPEPTFTIVEPLPEAISAPLDRSLRAVRDHLYEGAVAHHLELMESASSSRMARYENRLAALHARFGRLDLARTLLEAALERDPRFQATYVNLANVLLIEGDAVQAAELLELGVERAGESATLVLALAQAYHAAGKTGEAAESYRHAVEIAPDIARNYAYLAGSSDATGRAGFGGGAVFLWDGGEE
jgi:tetratricopeptide (TPR) repeat protein